jgi:ubiquinone biosynthesis protein COQ9
MLVGLRAVALYFNQGDNLKKRRIFMATKLTAQKILDTALHLAEKNSWETMQLHTLAKELGVHLQDIKPYFQSKEQLVAVWFSRADEAMLKVTSHASYKKLPIRECLHHLILIWVTALAKYPHVTQQMLAEASSPGNLLQSWQILACLRRSTDWLYEALHRDHAGLPIILEKTGLASLLLTTLAYRLNDYSENARNTEKFLHAPLHTLENGAHFLKKWCYKPYQHFVHAVSQRLF